MCTGTYYNNAVPIVCHPSSMHITQKHASQIDLQLEKQGYRLAIWLNTIFG